MKEPKGVLLIDDEETILSLLKRVLEIRHSDVDVTTATTGEEGVRQFENSRPFLTFLDLALPDINGIEVLQRIRQIDPEANVIMLTGMSDIAMEAKARDNGAMDFLRKGLGIEVFIKTFENALKRAAEPQDKQELGRILVVDDDAFSRDFLGKFLRNKDFEVQVAESGREAIEILKKERPHIVLLDINMPEMDGFETLRQIRELDKEIGIIMITGAEDQASRTKLSELGASDIIMKPFNLEYLETSVLSKIISMTW